MVLSLDSRDYKAYEEGASLLGSPFCLYKSMIRFEILCCVEHDFVLL
jgi:hypothetical protein